MAFDKRFCDGYLTIKPRKGQKGKVVSPRQSTNNVYHVQNAFHKAVEDGDITQVKVLLRYAQMNIHLNESNRNGRTALQECCLKDDLELIRLLVDNGASLEATDSYGWTTLHYASFFGSLDIVRFLVLNCADLTAVNNSGETPYDLAQQSDVRFYIQGMMMLKKEDSSEVDDDDDYYSDERSWRNESDNDSVGNSIDVKTIEEIGISDSHDTIDTGYEDDTPPLSPTKMQEEKSVIVNHRHFGLLRPNGLIAERKQHLSPRSAKNQNKKVSELNAFLDVVKEDELRCKITRKKEGKIKDDVEENEEDREEEEEEEEERQEAAASKFHEFKQIDESDPSKNKFGFYGANVASSNTVKYRDVIEIKEEDISKRKPSGIPRLNLQKKALLIKKETFRSLKGTDSAKTKISSKVPVEHQKSLSTLKEHFKLLRIRKVSSEPDMKNIPEEEYFQKPGLKKMANMEHLHMIETEKDLH